MAAARTTADALDRAESSYMPASVVRAHVDVVARLLDRPSTIADLQQERRSVAWVSSRPTRRRINR